jgi:microcystin-dependent protein
MEININKKTILGFLILSSSFIFADYTSSYNTSSKNVSSNDPVGTIVIWSKEDIPMGWLEVNGQDITEHEELSNIYGNNLPDLRGRFVRGFGGNSGALGELQEQSMASHNHTATFSGNSLPPHSHNYTALASNQESHGNRDNNAANDNLGYYNFNSISAGTPSGTVSIGNTGESELRPLNVALKYIVKAD